MVTGSLGGGGYLQDIEIQPDGRIIAVGFEQEGGFSPASIALRRYLSDGTPDPSFGTDGNVLTSLAAHPNVSPAHAWLIDPAARTLEVFRREDGRWDLPAHAAKARVRAEPFDAIELELGALWALAAK
jgi:hypothetical protein